MPDAEANPSPPAPPNPPSDSAAPDVAWQPITFRGVAAFAQAKNGRLLLAQFIVALLVAGAVAWFLSIHWFPSVRKAIRQLPESGLISDGRLDTPRDTVAPLAETRFLAFVVDVADTGIASSVADVRVEFRRETFAVCAFAGCVARQYPPGHVIQFNRPELESWWGAWQPTLFVLTSIAVVIWLFASWFALATLYFPAAWLIAYFKDRQLTPFGAWKLANAALLPGALLVALGIVLYGLGIADLLRVLFIWVAHIPVGWAYLVGATLRRPRVGEKGTANPFSPPKKKSRNPFGRRN